MAATKPGPVRMTSQQKRIEKILESWEGLKPKHKQPPVEDIILSRVKKPKRPDVRRTAIAGVALWVEPGTKPRPRVPLETIGGLAVVGSEFVSLDDEVKKLIKKRDKLNEGIKKVNKAHNGLRGTELEKVGRALDVAPRYTVDYDAERLEAELGLAAPQVIGKRLEATVGVPLGHETNKGPLTAEILKEAVTEALVGLGLPEARLGTVVGVEENPTVNEEVLGKMLADGRLSSLGGAAEITSETWAINVRPLRGA